MMVVGLDPGSRRFGVGILTEEGGKIRLIHHETISLREREFYPRMKVLWENLDALLERYSVTTAAMEEGFLGRNPKSMSVLSQVRGVATAMLLKHHLPLTTYSPRTVKQALTGNGNAEKLQVHRMVERLLRIELPAGDHDRSDALAVAYCHILSASGPGGRNFRPMDSRSGV